MIKVSGRRAERRLRRWLPTQPGDLDQHKPGTPQGTGGSQRPATACFAVSWPRSPAVCPAPATGLPPPADLQLCTVPMFWLPRRGHYAGGTRSNMLPDMLIAALPTDLHLYARPPASCRVPPLVPMSWPPMQLTARPRSKLRPEGAFLRPTSQPDPGVKHPFSGPFKPATHPVDRRDELRQAAQWCLWADPLTQSEQVGEPP
jgi:hypothetical protein